MLSSTTTAAAEAGAFAAALRARGLDDPVAERARATVLHDLACAIAAPAATAQIAWSIARDSGTGARLLVDGGPASFEQAAFANAVLIHARAQDDAHYGSHAHLGAAVLPAALAAAQRSGGALLTGFVAGCEIAAAIGELAPARGFRASSVVGPLGAAAAAATIGGADAAGIARAIALAASFAGGLNQTWLDGTGEWSFQLGAAARGGMTAALLAEAGVQPAPRALDGPQGLAAAFAGVDLPPLELGARWRTLELEYKAHPVCSIAQAPVELAVECGLPADEIAHVRCWLHPADHAYPGTLGRGPFAHAGGALMSVAFCVAAALTDGVVTPAALSGAPPAVMDRVELLADPALPPLAARLEVTSRAGTRHLRERLREAPWSWERVVAQGRALCAEVDAPAEPLLEAVGSLDADALIAATVFRREPRSPG